MTVHNYKEGREIPTETVEHFIDCKKKDERPLIFEHVPHILVAGSVDISNAKVIKFR